MCRLKILIIFNNSHRLYLMKLVESWNLKTKNWKISLLNYKYLIKLDVKIPQKYKI